MTVPRVIQEKNTTDNSRRLARGGYSNPKQGGIDSVPL